MMNITKIVNKVVELNEQYSEGIVSKVDMAVKIRNNCQELIDWEVYKAELIIKDASSCPLPKKKGSK